MLDPFERSNVNCLKLATHSPEDTDLPIVLVQGKKNIMKYEAKFISIDQSERFPMTIIMYRNCILHRC